MRKERLLSFVAGDFIKHVDVTKVGRESKIRSIANRFCIPCKRQAFARTSGRMTCTRSTAITFLSQLLARPAQFFNHLQHAQMLLCAFFEAQLQIFVQERAIHIAHKLPHNVIL